MKKKGFKTLITGRFDDIVQYVLQPKVRSLLPSNMTQNFTNFQINFDQFSNQGTPTLTFSSSLLLYHNKLVCFPCKVLSAMSNFTDACSLNI
jgi:hypothetical protein